MAYRLLVPDRIFSLFLLNSRPAVFQCFKVQRYPNKYFGRNWLVNNDIYPNYFLFILGAVSLLTRFKVLASFQEQEL